MSFLELVGNFEFKKAYYLLFPPASHLKERESPPQLETRVQKALHVRQLPIGDGSARCFSVTASVMLMIKSIAVLSKEFLNTNFTHLAVMCSTLFTAFFGVGGVKMVIDGRRECQESLRTSGGKQKDWKGALMTGNRVVEGTIMIGIALASLVTSIIYMKHALGLNTPNYWVGDMLQSLSSLAFGVYTLFEWAGAFLESRKFRSLKGELSAALGDDRKNYAQAIEYLKQGVVVTEEEKAGLLEDQVIELTRAKEDLFALFWGRELMLNVRDLSRDDPRYLQKAEAIAKEAVRWNNERCLMVRVNFTLFSLAIAVVVGCVLLTGGIPALGSALVMCGVSLVLNYLNTRRIFLYFKSKELGVRDERLLAMGMFFVVASMASAILLVGGGPIAIALFSVTGALILVLKGFTLYKLRALRKAREAELSGVQEGTVRATPILQL